MKRIRVAKVLMTFVLLGGSLLSFVLDWSPNHLLNPLWHPHARFHGALLLFLAGGRVDDGDLAALAAFQRAAGGVPGCSGAVGRLLDSAVLYPIFVAVFDVVGGKAGSRAAHRWRDGVSESGGRRSVSLADGRGISAGENRTVS